MFFRKFSQLWVLKLWYEVKNWVHNLPVEVSVDCSLTLLICFLIFAIRPESRVVGNLNIPAEFNLEKQSAPEWCTPVNRSTATETEVSLDEQRRSMTQIWPVAMSRSSDVEMRVDRSKTRPRTDRSTVSGKRWFFKDRRRSKTNKRNQCRTPMKYNEISRDGDDEFFD